MVRPDRERCAVGESGRVVISHLSNWVMPFLNYELGDRAALGPPCPCGRGFPTIQALEGRTSEALQTPTAGPSRAARSATF